MTGSIQKQSGTEARPLRIALLSSAMHDGQKGGLQRVVIDVANEMHRRGHEVILLTYERDSQDLPFPLSPDVREVSLQPRDHERSGLRRLADRVRRRLTRMAFNTRLVHRAPIGRLVWWNQYGAYPGRLTRWLDANPVDVAVAFLPPAQIALARARPKRPVARVLSLHTIPRFEFDPPPRSAADNPYQRAIMRESLVQFDAITILKPAFADWFPADVASRLVVVPNALKAVPVALRARAKEKTVLYVGRFTGVKRPMLLMEAWARLAEDFPDWRLEMCGDGPQRGACEALARQSGMAGRVHFPGMVDDVPERMARAAVFAHPASYEAFGLVVAEALDLKTPVIGFAQSGLSDLVRSGINGLLVDEGEDPVAAFAEGLAQLLSDDRLRQRLGAAGPASVAHYSPEVSGDLWERVLVSAAQGKPGPG